MTWRGAAATMGFVRLAVAAAGLLAVALAAPRRNPLLERQLWHDDPWSPNTLLEHALLLADRWDARWYLGIAADGYGEGIRQAAFFPLYPLLVGSLASAGVPLLAAAAGLSLLSALAAAGILSAVARQLTGSAAAARWSVLLWATFPASVVLSAAYPEALLAALLAGTWLAALRGRRLLGGLLCGLCLLTKPLGVAAVPLLLLQRGSDAERPWRRPRTWIGLAVAALLAALWPAWLAYRFGNPLRFVEAQASWGRAGEGIPVLSGIVEAAAATARGVRAVTLHDLDTGPRALPAFGDPIGLGLQHVAGAITVLLVSAGAALAWRRYGAGAGASAAVCALLPAVAASDAVPLMSAPRFALLALPCFVVLGHLVHEHPLRSAVLAGQATLLGVAAAGWATWQWFW